MPEGKVLLSSPRHSMSFEVMDDKNGLPELQVNGIYCKSDQECSSSNIEVGNHIHFIQHLPQEHVNLPIVE